MHRSGTSALTGVLNCLGIYLGSNLLQANAGNEKGYFENRFLLQVNENLLNTIGSSWNDIFFCERKLDAISDTSDLEKVLHQEFFYHDLFAIKDPRLGYLFPIYEKILKKFDVEISIVIPVRHPLEVALSLQKRERFPIERALLLWAYHILYSEKWSRKYPRYFVEFHELLSDPENTIKEANKRLPINLAERFAGHKQEVFDFLDRRLRHHKNEEILSIESAPRVIQRLFAAQKYFNTDKIETIFDGLREEFLDYRMFFYDAQDLEPKLRERQKYRQSLHRQIKKLKESTEYTRKLINEMQLQKDLLSQTRVQLNEKTAANLNLQQQLNENEKTLLLEKQRYSDLQIENNKKDQETSLIINTVRQFMSIKRKFVQQIKIIRLRDQIKLLEASLLFDDKFYLYTYPELKEKVSLNPVEHYLLYGVDELRNPSDYFHTRYYLEKYPDVQQSNINPLVHYILYGDREGRKPNPGFSPDWYRKIFRDADNTQIVSLQHYLLNGRKQGVYPQSFFKASWYVKNNQDVAKSGMSPYLHYLLIGESQGRQPNPAYFNMKQWVCIEDFALVYSDSMVRYRKVLHIPQDRVRREHFSSNAAVVIPFTVPAEGHLVIHIPIKIDTITKKDSIQFLLTNYCEETVFSCELPLHKVYRERKVILNIGKKLLPLGKYLMEMRLILSSSQHYELVCAEYDDSYVSKAVNEIVGPEVDQVWPRSVNEVAKKNTCLLCNYKVLEEYPDIDERLNALDSQADIINIDIYENLAQFMRDLDKYRYIAIVDLISSQKIPIEYFDGLVYALYQRGATFVFLAPVQTTRNDILKNLLHMKGLASVAAHKCSFIIYYDGLESWAMNGFNDSNGRNKLTKISSISDLDVIKKAIHYESEPHFAMITILYRKTEYIASFLRAMYRQNYCGKITVIFIDDCSPGESFIKVQGIIDDLEPKRPDNVNIVSIKNDENIGNCLSRNKGIASVDADIYSIIDCDCLINDDFVNSHVHMHNIPKTDVVVGALNLETNGRDVWKMMRQLETSPQLVTQEMNMQDNVQLNGFVNTITRNISIKKDVFQCIGMYDDDFSYSMKKKDSFGWEDVEFGARLYAHARNIRFTPKAFSIHQSHPGSIAMESQIVGSATNFNKLFIKHPFLLDTARRWATATSEKILNWADQHQVEHDQLVELRRLFKKPKSEAAPYIHAIRQKKRLKILQYRWHVPHQYEIHKLPHDFTLVTHIGTNFSNKWDYQQRPMRQNVKMVPVTNIDENDYDLAIVHFDENVLCSDVSNNVLGDEWGNAFKWFMANISLPKIAVCHGTPAFYGQYGANPNEIDQFDIYKFEHQRLVEILRNVKVVCNSWQAFHEWQFADAQVIWHGLDPQEIPCGTHERDVITHGKDLHRIHYRGSHFLDRVLTKLNPGISVNTHRHFDSNVLPLVHPEYSNYSLRSWIDHLGSHKIYLNTTIRSPMPRSRTEAMMAGVVPVSLQNHDVDCFVENGINGFYSTETDELSEYINFLISHPAAWQRISNKARSSAIDVFNNDRFLAQWSQLLQLYY